ncbi:hypothetical protein PVW48_11460 [Dinoroseobacter sp. PD6]|uniref:hypothetical protein n=1 Tax=Dinoroseobacter sp. PD6 TaxID=3028384 RepID=UPI00237AFD3A|nr:hypothetical protein [Dinoroseobacter sp. PD6]MDD9717366.1 hypothetical protein [Dinoroseobacter sp. PD6]
MMLSKVDFEDLFPHLFPPAAKPAHPPVIGAKAEAGPDRAVSEVRADDAMIGAKPVAANLNGMRQKEIA